MYDSGTTAADLIATLREELDIAVVISDESFIRWLNIVEQTVYTELIRELRHFNTNVNDSYISVSAITPASGEGAVIFDDIIKVYGDGRELERATMISGYVFTDLPCYWQDGNNIAFENIVTPTELDIFYVVRPSLKTISGADNVKLPAEWLEIAAARLKGEAYKQANDDNLAAKWLNDYNLYLEQFKVWLKKNKVYGER